MYRRHDNGDDCDDRDRGHRGRHYGCVERNNKKGDREGDENATIKKWRPRGRGVSSDDVERTVGAMRRASTRGKGRSRRSRATAARGQAATTKAVKTIKKMVTSDGESEDDNEDDNFCRGDDFAHQKGDDKMSVRYFKCG